MVANLICSLVSTLIIELITSYIQKVKVKSDYKVIILANIITNPLIVFIGKILIMLWGKWITDIIILLMEILVVLVEGKIFKEYSLSIKENPYKFSLINNSISYFIGIMLQLILVFYNI